MLLGTGTLLEVLEPVYVEASPPFANPMERTFELMRRWYTYPASAAGLAAVGLAATQVKRRAAEAALRGTRSTGAEASAPAGRPTATRTRQRSRRSRRR